MRQWHGAEHGLIRTTLGPHSPYLCPEPYLRLMRHHKGAGRADRVSQVYWDCRKTLKHKAGITPGAAFEDAYKKMR